jgi:uncharacterized phiE125 gp8 family phage protein
MRYTLKQGPTTYPVSEAELADLLALDNYTDPLLRILLHSANTAAISFTGRAFLNQEFTIQWDGYPGFGTETGGLDMLRRVPAEWVELPYAPLVSIQSVKFIDLDGLETVIDLSELVIDTINEPGRFKFRRGAPVLPSNTRMVVEYTSGYGEDPEGVPFAIRLAVLQAAGYLYEHRGECTADSAITKSGAAAALMPFRMMRL